MKIQFNSPSHLAFDFFPDYLNLLKKFNGVPVVHRRYSIDCKQHVYHNAYYESIISSHALPLLSRHGLSVLKWDNTSYLPAPALSEFRQALLSTILNWIKRYLEILVDHFKNRYSENRGLLNHNTIKIQFGWMIDQVAHLSEIIFIPALFNQAAQLIQKVCRQFHKLAGARSFLEASIVEMMHVFNVMIKIYF